MGRAMPYPAETRAAVEAALWDSAEPMTAIAKQFGLSYGTVRDWNRASGIRLSVRRHPTRDALRGLAAVRGGASELPDLRAALREHLGRQIAVLDARLCRAGTAPDSGRMLRDLAGFKRLLDELEAEAAAAAIRQAEEQEETRDIAAAREELARRIETMLKQDGFDASFGRFLPKRAEDAPQAPEVPDEAPHAARDETEAPTAGGPRARML